MDYNELMQRVRAGDPLAAQQLVSQYETELKIIARSRMRDSRLRRTVDSSDICQSVFASFFVRASAGQFDISSPDDLIKLLVQMVRNKATDQLRKHRAGRRDVAKLASAGVDEMAIADQGESPSVIVATRELVENFRERLPDDIKQISELRREGNNWDEIAAKIGGTPEAIRKRFSRALDKAAIDVGIDVDLR